MELFAADGHDAGGCERVTGKSGMRPSYVAQELRRAGVRFQMDDNAIVRCADPDQLTAVAERLDERVLRQRADYWASRLTPRFSPRESAACGLDYQWSVAQIEFARDVIFHRRARLHDLFQRAVEIGVALGGATQTRHLFGRHQDGQPPQTRLHWRRR